jgi:hypothetical protein
VYSASGHAAEPQRRSSTYKGTVWGLRAALSLKVSVPDDSPEDAGLNSTVTEHVRHGINSPPHELAVIANGLPLIVTL